VSSYIPAHVEHISDLRAKHKETLLQAEVSNTFFLGPLSTLSEADMITATHIIEEEQRCMELEEKIIRAQNRDIYNRALQKVMRALLYEVVLTVADEVSSEVCFSHSWAKTTAASIMTVAASNTNDGNDELLSILKELQSFRLLNLQKHVHTLPVVPSSKIKSADEEIRFFESKQTEDEPARIDKKFEVNSEWLSSAMTR
jgi:hypothetical protein